MSVSSFLSQHLMPLLLIFRAKWLRRLINYLIISLGSGLLFLVILDQFISFYVRDDIYQDINTVPNRPYGVVLGTAKYVAKNRLNQFYQNRLKAAEALFNQHKVKYLLLSGDNSTLQYNEPRTMFKDLRKRGIDEQYLYMDFAGFRTLDSIIRAHHIFHAYSMTIITQKFHCERALFIARYHNIDAICFAAEQPNLSIMIRIREFFARLQALLDLVLGIEPHFLGTSEPLPASE